MWLGSTVGCRSTSRGRWLGVSRDYAAAQSTQPRKCCGMRSHHDRSVSLLPGQNTQVAGNAIQSRIVHPPPVIQKRVRFETTRATISHCDEYVKLKPSGAKITRRLGGSYCPAVVPIKNLVKVPMRRLLVSSLGCVSCCSAALACCRGSSLISRLLLFFFTSPSLDRSDFSFSFFCLFVISL